MLKWSDKDVRNPVFGDYGVALHGAPLVKGEWIFLAPGQEVTWVTREYERYMTQRYTGVGVVVYGEGTSRYVEHVIRWDGEQLTLTEREPVAAAAEKGEGR